MTQLTNHLGQPIGEPVPGWTARPRPPRTPMEGRHCRVVALAAAAHADALHRAYAADTEGRNWTYLPYGPFASAEDYAGFVEWAQSSENEVFYAIEALPGGQPIGVASYLRIDPDMGCIEVGHLSYAPALQRTVASTEAMYLMMRRVFDELGYRRYEWKCDARNAASRSAAERLGFTFEGVFRQHMVVKGLNRDTAWFSMTDGEWPVIRGAFEAWLARENFDAGARPQRPLAELRAEIGAI